MKITLLGAGSWGITLGCLLSKKGYNVILWEYDEGRCNELLKNREDPQRLPGVHIPNELILETCLERCFPTEFCVLVVPSHSIRGVVNEIKRFRPQKLISAVKGLELESLKRVSEIVSESFEHKFSFAVISGPSIALEVARGVPTSIVSASNDNNFAREVQHLFHTNHFRVYTSEDVIGVELGGTFKNIVAIAAGIADGLGLGVNSKGALLTRGLAEIVRLGRRLGAREETFSGLSFIGDLITTCFSQYSRNRFVGEELAKGKNIEEILKGMVMVAEGVRTTEAVYHLSRKLEIDMPITTAVYSIIKDNRNPQEVLTSLLEREPKPEIY